MKKYSDLIKEIKNSENFKNSSWESINPEYVQGCNFKTDLSLELK